MNRLSTVVLAFLGSLAAPASAAAAESFAGVLENGRLVTFTSPSPFALSVPRTPAGLAAGERLVALGDGPRGLLGVGSSARLYAVDAVGGAVSPIGPPFRQGLRGSRFSLAVAPQASTGRLLSDVGQDLVVDVLTGATSDGPGLRRADTGDQIRPAADLAADGRMVGVGLGPATVFRETAPGANAFTATSLDTSPAPAPARLGEPTAVALGSDGRGYLLAVASDRQRARQSLLARFDPASGGPSESTNRSVELFGRRLTAIASLGAAPEDRTPPRARVRLARRTSVRGLLSQRVPLVVRSSEAGQIVVSLRVGGEPAGFGFGTRDTPGDITLGNFSVAGRDRNRLRAAVGRRIRVIIGVNDFKGNRRTVVRTTRLVR